MKKIYLLITAITFCINVNSQNPSFVWAKGMGGSGTDVGNGIITDASGNVYSTGSFNGSADFDPGSGSFSLTSVGNVDIFISKLDAAGNFLWAKSVGGTSFDVGQSIAVDASGNSYITGYFINTVDFDPGPGVFNLTSASVGGGDIFILKLNASGNFVWAKRMGGNDPNGDVGYDIVLDNSGNIYTTGYYYGISDFDPGVPVFALTSTGNTDIFVSKLDASGNFVWAISIGGPGGFDNARSIALDNLMNVYITGAYAGLVDFDPGAGVFNMTSVTGNDIFVCKLNSAGNFVWAKSMGGNNSDQGVSITVDNSYNVFSTGMFVSSVVDFDPGPGVVNFTLVGNDNAYVSKLDVNGNFVWAKQLGGGTANTEGYGIKLDGSGNVITVGYFSNVTDFDPGPGVATFTAPANQRDIFINKLDPSGNYLWTGQMGNVNDDMPFDVDIDASGNIYATGRFQNTVDFDAGAGTSTVTSAGAHDAFVVKYASCAIPSQPGSVSGLNSMCAGVSATNYSIASIVGATSYTWSLPGGWSGTSATNTISATPGTTGIFTVTASNGCGTSPQQTLNVTVNPLPTITVNSGSICSGQSFTMVPSGASTYTIQGGSAVVSPTTTASYTVVGTSTAGCISASPATSNLTVSPLPTISASTSSTLICVGQSATLTASGALTYSFNPGGAGASIVVSPTVNSNYTITGTSAQGCNNSIVFTQSVSTCAGINQISNSSSEILIYPNPFNSKITIISSGTKQPVLVFNALGSLIYKTEMENEKIEIDLGKESAGIYFIRIGTEIKKIIKED